MSENIISLLNEEQLITTSDSYVCQNYQYKNKNITAIFKFYIGLKENWITFKEENIDISLNEKAKINELEKLQKISNGKTYHFAFRYSDFIEVDPKLL